MTFTKWDLFLWSFFFNRIKQKTPGMWELNQLFSISWQSNFESILKELVENTVYHNKQTLKRKLWKDFRKMGLISFNGVILYMKYCVHHHSTENALFQSNCLKRNLKKKYHPHKNEAVA